MILKYRLSKLLFEAALLKRIERTGYYYLGTGKENIASHSFGVIFCTYLLCKIFEMKRRPFLCPFGMIFLKRGLEILML